MIDSKTMAAIIAVSEAQQDIATNSKVFKDNLKLISERNSELTELLSTVKQQRAELADLHKTLLTVQADNDVAATRLDSAQGRLDKAKESLRVEKALYKQDKESLASDVEALSSRAHKFAEFEKSEKAFLATSAAKSSELDRRETALIEGEKKVAEILAVVNKVT